MNRLHDTQRDFSRYVLQESDHIPAGIKDNGIAPEQRLAIYRNNTRLGLVEVLREVYPVINNLVGAAFFNRLAQAYVRAHPLQSACLLGFGGQFAEVIAGFQETQGLAYLPDTARLEWYWQSSSPREPPPQALTDPYLRLSPSRSLNLLMKLLKPLCDKALRMFSSQQIYFAEINP